MQIASQIDFWATVVRMFFFARVADRAFGLRRPHIFAFSRRFFFQTKNNQKAKIAVWLETSSQFRRRFRDQISEEMIICMFFGGSKRAFGGRRPHNFALNQMRGVDLESMGILF